MSRKISFGGIFTAIAIILLYLASMMPTLKLSLYTLCSLPIAFIIIEAGVKAGFISYLAVSILAFLVIGKPLGVLPFILFFGHYSIFKFFIERKQNPIAEILLKLAVFNGSLLIGYFIYSQLLIVDMTAVLNHFSIPPVFIWIGLQPLFIFYDYVFTRLIGFYFQRIKNPA